MGTTEGDLSMDYYEEDIDSGEELEEDPLEISEIGVDETNDEAIEDVGDDDSRSSSPTRVSVLNPPTPIVGDISSGKDIAQVVGDLLQSNIFGDVAPNESLANMVKETVETSDRLRQEFEAKLRTIPLNKTEDYILNGQLYGDLASKALDANDQKIKTLNAISKFVPKLAPKSQVNIAQQMNNQQSVHNGVSPEQFVEVIKATEDAGLNPIAKFRDAEEEAASLAQMEEDHEEHHEEGDYDDSISSTGRNDEIIFSPSVDDFGS